MESGIPVQLRAYRQLISGVLILKEGFAALFIFVGDVGRTALA